jgi:hypothetical protein
MDERTGFVSLVSHFFRYLKLKKTGIHYTFKFLTKIKKIRIKIT